MLAIALGLSSGLLWGVGDFTGGFTSRRLQVLAVMLWSQLAGFIYLGALVAIVRPGFEWEGLLWGYVAGAFTGIGLLFFYRGLAAGAMSIVAPISSFGAVVPLVVAFARGDAPTAMETAGIAVALVGVVVLSIPSTATPHPSGRPIYVTVLALGAALGFGLFYVFVDLGAGTDAGPLWVVLAARAGALTSALALLATRRASLPGPGQLWPVLLALGIMDSTANALFAWASTEGNVAVVSVLGSLYPLTTVGLAWAIAHERVSAMQYGGAGAALVGVALIAAG